MHKTTWLDNLKTTTKFPKLTKNIKTDIAIAGGGIAGVLTAYLLAKKGSKVVLLEKNKIGEGTTGYTTAFITYVIDARLRDHQDSFGKEGAKKIWQSHREAVDLIEKIVKTEKINCAFKRCSAYYWATSEKEFSDLKHEAKLAKDLGFKTQIKDSKFLPFKNYGCLVFPNQAKFQPVEFVKQLAKVSSEIGVKIFEDTEVIALDDKDPTTIKTRSGSILTKHVVVDTYNPFEAPTMEFQQRIVPFQSYVIEADAKSLPIDEALYWDTSEPYNYFRVDKFGSHLSIVFGGLDHKTGEKEPTEPYKKLEQALKKLFPKTQFKVTKKWTSQVLETTDGVAIIGKTFSRKNQYFSTGFSGNGMTYAGIGAQLTTDLVLGNKNKYQEIYSPQRFKKPLNILSQHINYIKRMATDYLPGQYKEDSINNIPKDSGKVLVIRGQRVAVYRAKSGEALKLSPICTHLKCIVAWNDTDKSWDCPCHGSRYTKEGEVLNGPAKLPLKKV